MVDENLYIWKCPMCKITFQVHKEATHPWSKENHLLSCANQHIQNVPEYNVPESNQHFKETRKGFSINKGERLNETVEGLKNMNLSTLMYLRWGLFIAVVVNMFGIYWYLDLKTIGMALMLVIMVALALTFILENRRRKMGDKEPKPIDLGLKNGFSKGGFGI